MTSENKKEPVPVIRQPKSNRKRHKKVSYAKYGYLFLIPFIVVFLIFQFVPLVQTGYYSFFEYYFKRGIQKVGPNFRDLSIVCVIFHRSNNPIISLSFRS